MKLVPLTDKGVKQGLKTNSGEHQAWSGTEHLPAQALV